MFLQDFPPGIETEMDAAKHLQQARYVNQLVENYINREFYRQFKYNTFVKLWKQMKSSLTKIQILI